MTTCVGIVCRVHAHIASLKMANNMLDSDYGWGHGDGNIS